MDNYKSQIDEFGNRMNLALEQGDYIAWTVFQCLRKELQRLINKKRNRLVGEISKPENHSTFLHDQK